MIYDIREDGTVWSLRYRNSAITKQLSGVDNGRGYLSIWLTENGERKRRYIHRLVAEKFLPNPDRLPTVNHKNGDKTDNRASNLEWASYSDNHKHAYKYLGRKHYNAVKTHCIRGHEFTPENTRFYRWHTGVQRHCLECRGLRQALQKNIVGQI